MRLTHLTRDQYRVVPWRNGGGVTTEIAVRPAAPAEFVWRISIADVPSDGPFSNFAGFDRTLMLTDGMGLVLRHENRGEQRLDRPYRPVRFSGDWPTYATLIDGPTRDLNVITRRDSAQHAVTVLEGDGAHAHVSAADVLALLCLRGEGSGRADETRFALSAGETVLLDRDPDSVGLSLETAARDPSTVLVLVDIFVSGGA